MSAETKTSYLALAKRVNALQPPDPAELARLDSYSVNAELTIDERTALERMIANARRFGDQWYIFMGSYLRKEQYKGFTADEEGELL